MIEERLFHAEHFLLCCYRTSVFDLPQVGGKEMIHYMIDLVGVFISSGLLEYAIYPIFCLGFLCTVPCFIRRLFGG